jgi:ABC-type bacteriocin/lantibiotic exporter with double-glycine peptidase domain
MILSDSIYHKQETNYTCGEACLKMFYNKIKTRKSESQLTKEIKPSFRYGTTQQKLEEFVNKNKFQYVAKGDSTIKETKLLLKKNYFIIVNYLIEEENEGHYAVIKKITKEKIFLLDPYLGPNYFLSIKKFNKLWNSVGRKNNKNNWFIALKK